MERLTKIYDNGFVTLDATQFAPVSQDTLDGNIRAFKPFAAAVKRLAEYEDTYYTFSIKINDNQLPSKEEFEKMVLESAPGTIEVFKCDKCNKDVNPYPKYSYNSGLCYTNGEKAFGTDVNWTIWELKHGRNPVFESEVDK